MDSTTIQQHLFGYLRLNKSGIIMPNIWLEHSPWECDMIAVTEACYYSEYEIKVSVADYQNDFRKRLRSWSKQSVTKHETLASGEDHVFDRRFGSKSFLPRPKQFYFVVPAGLLDKQTVPEHCGIMEFDPTFHGWKIRTKREAPKLKKPTKLSQKAIFAIGCKASQRLCFQSHGFKEQYPALSESAAI